jgi:hypothetical protein
MRAAVGTKGSEHIFDKGGCRSDLLKLVVAEASNEFGTILLGSLKGPARATAKIDRYMFWFSIKVMSLSGRQPGQAICGRAPLIRRTDTYTPGLRLASARPSARKGTTRGVPPLPISPNPADTVRCAGGCMQPVLLRGRVDHIDGAAGELLHR